MCVFPKAVLHTHIRTNNICMFVFNPSPQLISVFMSSFTTSEYHNNQNPQNKSTSVLNATMRPSKAVYLFRFLFFIFFSFNIFPGLCNCHFFLLFFILVALSSLKVSHRRFYGKYICYKLTSFWLMPLMTNNILDRGKSPGQG